MHLNHLNQLNLANRISPPKFKKVSYKFCVVDLNGEIIKGIRMPWAPSPHPPKVEKNLFRKSLKPSSITHHSQSYSNSFKISIN